MSIYTVKRLMDKQNKDMDDLEKYFEDTAQHRKSDRRNLMVVIILVIFCLSLIFIKRLVVLWVDYRQYKLA